MKFLSGIFQRGKKETPHTLQAVQQKFTNFLAILENNNRVLKNISDMEEKSGGEYLFDINYIRSSLADSIRILYREMKRRVPGSGFALRSSAIGEKSKCEMGASRKQPDNTALSSEYPSRNGGHAMKTNEKILFFLLAFLLLFSLRTVRAEETAIGTEAAAKNKALASAKAWLGTVDQGNYAQSWKEAAPYFKKAVTQDQWLQSMTAFRLPLGKVLSRVPDSSHYTETLPGAPDGRYVVIQFNTSFENKKSAVETVTPMLCPDGMWRVSGYFIK